MKVTLGLQIVTVGMLYATGSIARTAPREPAAKSETAAGPRAEKAREYRLLLSAVERGDLATTTRLIRRGVDVNGREAGKSFAERQRPLATAAAKGRLDLVNALLDAGADPNACCCSCVAALHEAIRGGHTPIVARLLDAGANARLVYDGSKTPLALARERGSKDIVILLEKSLAKSQ